MPEELLFGLKLALVGLLIVFVSLAIISLVVTAIQRLDQRWQSREARQDQERSEREPTLDSTTLVVITAAVATLLGGRHRIRSVRRIQPVEASGSAWSSHGRAVLHGSHRTRRR